MPKLKIYSLILIIIVIGSLASPDIFAKRLTVGVIYPGLREPYRSVFKNIVSGIEEDSTYRVAEYVLREEDQLSDVMHWLQKNKIEVVTALGSRGVKIAREFPETIKVVFGAVLIPPDSLPPEARGITLSPDPAVLFTHLKKLTPQLDRITVIYNPKHFEWLISLANSAAREAGINRRRKRNCDPARKIALDRPDRRCFRTVGKTGRFRCAR